MIITGVLSSGDDDSHDGDPRCGRQRDLLAITARFCRKVFVLF